MAGRGRPTFNKVVPYVVGAVGAVAVAAIGLLMYFAIENFFDVEELEVTREEVQLAAVNAYLRTRELPAGSELSAVLEYGGSQCGGVVEIRVVRERQVVDETVFILTQDSGAALASEVPGLSRAEARGRMTEQKQACS